MTNYSEYTKDESGIVGRCTNVYLPTNKNEALSAINEIALADSSVTVQGAKTGICGSAVPLDTCVISTQKMNKILGFTFDEQTNTAQLIVQPGVTLEHIEKSLVTKTFNTELWDDHSKNSLDKYKSSDVTLFFPPNPTETTATLGGCVACSSSGSNIAKYGEISEFIQEIEYILPNKIKKTNVHTPDKSRFACAGYKSSSDIELMCGSEGTLGFISEITLRLLPKPMHNWAVLLYFDTFEQINNYFNTVKCDSIVCVDYFNKGVFNLLNSLKQTTPTFKNIPDIHENAKYCVYVEICGNDEEALTDNLEELLVNLPVYEDFALAATSKNELEHFRNIWHSAIESFQLVSNKYQCELPMIDIILPDKAMLSTFANLFKSSELHFMIFGHYYINHLHIRIMPKDSDELKHANHITSMALEKCIKSKCKCSSEFGTGIKKMQLFKLLSGGYIETMHKKKHEIDSNNLFHPNLFITTGDL